MQTGQCSAQHTEGVAGGVRSRSDVPERGVRDVSKTTESTTCKNGFGRPF